MLKDKDTVEIVIPELTNEEFKIVKELGYCGLSKKLMQVYCIDYSIFITLEKYLENHSNHKILENYIKNSKKISHHLKTIIQEKQGSRVRNLSEKIRCMERNLMDLKAKRSAAEIQKKWTLRLKKLVKKLQFVSLKKLKNGLW